VLYTYGVKLVSVDQSREEVKVGVSIHSPISRDWVYSTLLFYPGILSGGGLAMDNSIFEGTALVEIQGDRALRLVSLEPDCAEYRVLGFEEPISIHDYRRVSLDEIKRYQMTKQVADFATRFNAPAFVMLSERPTHETRIELYDTDDADPDYRLWAAIGLRDSIPVYEYLYDRISALDNDSFAFLALYRRHRETQSASPVLAGVSGAN